MTFKPNEEGIRQMGRDVAAKLADEYQAGFDEFQTAHAGRPASEIADDLEQYLGSTPFRMSREAIENTAAEIARGVHVNMRGGE